MNDKIHIAKFAVSVILLWQLASQLWFHILISYIVDSCKNNAEGLLGVAKRAELAGATRLTRHLGRTGLRFLAQYPKLACTV
jgi:hypothetical protein